MTVKYAYINPQTREYEYTESREELINVLAAMAAEMYCSHYCNGEPYSIVEVDESGAEKWYTPTGEQRMTHTELEAHIKYLNSFRNAGEIPVTIA
jgi:hypothetical protein